MRDCPDDEMVVVFKASPQNRSWSPILVQDFVPLVGRSACYSSRKEMGKDWYRQVLFLLDGVAMDSSTTDSFIDLLV